MNGYEWLVVAALVAVVIVIAVVAVALAAVFYAWRREKSRRQRVEKEAVALADLTRALLKRLSARSRQVDEFVDFVQGSERQYMAAREGVGSLRDTMSSARVEMSTLATAADQVLANLKNISEGAQDTSININTVAAAAEQMNLSLREVARNCMRTARAADSSNSKATEAQQQISSLVEAVGQIGKIVGLIEDIADQTNLLALNAAIEAASAGDAGRGFSVVASEVKSLARQTASATEEIAAYIARMQSDTTLTVERIGEVTRLSEEVNQLSDMIAAAVEEQTATTNEIARSVLAGASATTDMSHSVQEMLRGSEDMSQTAESILGTVTQAVEGIDRIHSSGEEMTRRLESSSVAGDALKETNEGVTEIEHKVDAVLESQSGYGRER